jgi:hypothetical protein
LAVDATHIYWGDKTTQYLWRADIDGSNAAPLIDFFLPLVTWTSVDVSSSDIYLTETDSFNFCIDKIAKDLSDAGQLVCHQSSFPIGLAVDDDYTYWTNSVGNIVRADHFGNGVVTLVSGQGGSTALAVNAAHLYWTNPSTGEIVRANLDGSNVTVIGHAVTPTAIAVIGSHVYWGTAAGTIVRADLDGSNASVIATDAGGIPVEGLAVTP